MTGTNFNRTRVLSIAGCLLVQLCVGIIYLWSIFKAPVAAAFGCATEELGMVSSYMLTAFVTGSLLGGILNDRKGPRLTCLVGVTIFSAGIAATAWLTPDSISLINLTYSILGGLGSGLAYSACISCIQKWLPDRRGLATGLAVASFGLSTVVFTPVSRILMSACTSTVTGLVDFRLVFSILALVFLIFGLVGCLMIRSAPRPEAPANAAAPGRTVDIPIGKAIRTLPFWCIFLTVFFINATWNLTVPVLYDLGVERGLTASAAAFAVSFTGVANTAGRLIMATISDKLGRRRCICLLAVLTAAAALLMIFVQGQAYIVAVSIIAFAYGGPSSINAAMTTDYFGSRCSGTNYGVVMLALGLSSLFFNALSATVFNGNLTLSLVMAAVFSVIPLALMAIIGKPPASVAEKLPNRGPNYLEPLSHGA